MFVWYCKRNFHSKTQVEFKCKKKNNSSESVFRIKSDT